MLVKGVQYKGGKQSRQKMVDGGKALHINSELSWIGSAVWKMTRNN
jgi:hypothetical protein